jgi:hypothetical protein
MPTRRAVLCAACAGRGLLVHRQAIRAPRAATAEVEPRSERRSGGLGAARAPGSPMLGRVTLRAVSEVARARAGQFRSRAAPRGPIAPPSRLRACCSTMEHGPVASVAPIRGCPAPCYRTPGHPRNITTQPPPPPPPPATPSTWCKPPRHVRPSARDWREAVRTKRASVASRIAPYALPASSQPSAAQKDVSAFLRDSSILTRNGRTVVASSVCALREKSPPPTSKC